MGALREFWKRTTPRARDRAEWEQARQRGYADWILWKGILGFSLQIGLLVHGTMLLVGVRPWTSSAALNLGLLAMWLVGGFAAGDLTWRQFRNRFDR